MRGCRSRAPHHQTGWAPDRYLRGVDPETLGPETVATPIDATNPTYVAQYSPHGPDSRFDAADPRQHAIGLTWMVTLVGALSPQGEATGFDWFPVDALPPPHAFGFGQHNVVRACLERQRTTGHAP
ncbi:MAG: DUF4916 domain-containing protein [Chloroflexi bacterium]|nr:DUF4916 domain-containing protein [Chloroflexota bacterium]